MIGVLHATHFFARDLPKQLFSRLRTVGLKTASQGQVTIPSLTDRPSLNQLASAQSNSDIFTKIDVHEHCNFHPVLILKVKRAFFMRQNPDFAKKYSTIREDWNNNKLDLKQAIQCIRKSLQGLRL